ncbi:hypothetical protein QVA66_05050 [Staphylococcus chromogenes]|nr:hypothetical protein [Staphylococcus chromogenes]
MRKTLASAITASAIGLSALTVAPAAQAGETPQTPAALSAQLSSGTAEMPQTISQIMKNSPFPENIGNAITYVFSMGLLGAIWSGMSLSSMVSSPR